MERAPQERKHIIGTERAEFNGVEIGHKNECTFTVTQKQYIKKI